MREIIKQNFKRTYYVTTAFILVYITYEISLSLFKIGFSTASRNIYFCVLAIYLCVPLLKHNKYEKDIEIEKLQANCIVNKQLRSVIDSISLLEEIVIKKDDEEITLDNTIVTTKRGALNIVKCNYTGDIIIDKDNRWYSKDRKSISELITPITAIRKNREYLTNILAEDEIIDVVVMVNGKFFIEGEENSDAIIVEYDDLPDMIKEFNEDGTEDENKIYDKIYKKIIRVKDIAEEEKLYDSYIDNIWMFRSRLTFISMSFIFYILNILTYKK